jgi:hypothetical protein
MERLTYERAYWLAFKKYGAELGMFGRLLTKSKRTIQGKYFSYGLNKIITKEELLKFEANGN